MTAKTATKTMGLVATTKHKGVFFGYAPRPIGDIPDTIRLENARMCISWTSDVRGMPGLASCGPTKSCRVGFKTPAISVNDITGIFECSDAAIAAWEKGPF